MNDRDSWCLTHGPPKLSLHRAAIVASLDSSIIVRLRAFMPIAYCAAELQRSPGELGLVILDEDVGWCMLLPVRCFY